MAGRKGGAGSEGGERGRKGGKLIKGISREKRKGRRRRKGRLDLSWRYRRKRVSERAKVVETDGDERGK